jgi:hypothetical protein
MVNAGRRLRLWSLVVQQASGEPVGVEHVCAAAVPATGVDHAAVAVVLPAAAAPRATLCASDAAASTLEELTLTLGEGPGVDAVYDGPVLVADLASPEYAVRWPVYTPAASASGVQAVFALPLRVGAIRLGVLSLYRAEPGVLDVAQLADALILADTACALLLDAVQHDHLRADGDRPAQAGPQHPEVHQATGMLAEQLGVSAAVALGRLRAYAFAHDRLLHEVAREVVARRLRFHPDG